MKKRRHLNSNLITSKDSFILVLLLTFNLITAQNDVWINKNENENYQARHECSFVQAGDKFIMFGGREKAQKLDIYDYKTNTWSLGGSAPKQFNHFQATFYQGFVWVIGSFQTNKFPKETAADHVWLYYPPTKTWIQGAQIPKDRRRGGAGLAIYNDKFYIIGGNTIGHHGGYVNWFDEYDPNTNSWNRLENAPQKRDHFSAAIINHTLYAVGGRQSGGEGGVFAPLIGEIDTYNFKTKTWTTLNSPLPTPRAAPGVAVFKNKLFVMGGEGEKKGPAFKTLEVYSPKTKTWTTKADMHFGRHGTQAIVSGKGIYIAGGSPKRGGGNQHNMEGYNEDSPDGKPLIPSLLHTNEKIQIKAGTLKTVSIKNKKGNTGTFITSILLEGPHKDKFKLLSNLNLTLLKKGEKTLFKIEHLGNSKNDIVNIVITYNGDKKTKISVLSK